MTIRVRLAASGAAEIRVPQWAFESIGKVQLFNRQTGLYLGKTGWTRASSFAPVSAVADGAGVAIRLPQGLGLIEAGTRLSLIDHDNAREAEFSWPTRKRTSTEAVAPLAPALPGSPASSGARRSWLMPGVAVAVILGGAATVALALSGKPFPYIGFTGAGSPAPATRIDNGTAAAAPSPVQPAPATDVDTVTRERDDLRTRVVTLEAQLANKTAASGGEAQPTSSAPEWPDLRGLVERLEKERDDLQKQVQSLQSRPSGDIANQTDIASLSLTIAGLEQTIALNEKELILRKVDLDTANARIATLEANLTEAGSRPATRAVWGAAVVSTGGSVYTALNQVSSELAQNLATSSCLERNKGCRTLRTFQNECFSLAREIGAPVGQGSYGISSNANWRISEAEALKDCPGNCYIVFTRCTPDAPSKPE